MTEAERKAMEQKNSDKNKQSSGHQFGKNECGELTA